MHTDLTLFAKGIFIGILLALPTGPAGFLVVRETLTNGFRRGFVASLGGILTDFFYAVIVCFGLTAIGRLLLFYELPIRFVCALILMGVAAMTWIRANRITPSAKGSVAVDFFTVFSMSVTNPLIIISSTILFAAIGGPTLLSAGLQKGLFVAGITAGGLIWSSFFLSLLDYLRRTRKTPDTFLINRVFAAAVAFCGVTIMAKVLWVVFLAGRL